MEKRVKIYLCIAAILILLSLLPLLEAYMLHSNRQTANNERLLTELTIDKKNITEVNAADNINVDMISVEHIFTDDKGKEIVAHNMDGYQKLMKKSVSYSRTYQLGDQTIQFTENINKKRVSEILINKKKVNINIKTIQQLNNHYVYTSLIFEKKIATGETLLMLMQQNKEDIRYIGLQSHDDNTVGKTTLEAIDLDGVWNNRMNLVGFNTLPKQHLSYYIFHLFIFYPLLTLILGLFLCYICYLRVKTTRVKE
ncbi:hypothetical protein ACN5ZK_09685 [Macrococcoides bohemicum]|uniref:hypothetical protein n=1 Tax=Macrococcoides bohemicum TaxID=1903056 RepID=UPI000BB5816E|nr:hypothetical protein [Macrococcus]ATD30520.1 hypothetical protein BHM04_04720 [Macrococcus sp. IME1552]MBC9875177.1 hypothetical protein [Macrococcus bohemicus]TDL37059.1 hypothetical protein EVU91_08150 [Macrococcus bohemicus]